MTTKKVGGRKAAGKPRRKLALSKETLKDLSVKGTGVKGGMLAATKTLNRQCFSLNPSCLGGCTKNLDCI